jgi:hypothetical protein
VFSSLLLQLILSTLLGLAPAPALPAADTPSADTPLAPALTGLGTLHYPVSTTNADAQRFFDQGLRLLYAFNHPESLRAFKEATRLDPTLAMAYWGQAMTLSPNLNAPMTPENGRLAHAAIQQARTCSPTPS